MKIMDYSMLVGIHHIPVQDSPVVTKKKKPNGKSDVDDLEEDDDSHVEGEQIISPTQLYWPFQRFYDCHSQLMMDPPPISNNHHQHKPSRWEIPEFVNPISNRKDRGFYMDVSRFKLPIQNPAFSNTSKPQFQEYNGKIYYMGVIDILQQFNIRKRCEARY